MNVHACYSAGFGGGQKPVGHVVSHSLNLHFTLCVVFSMTRRLQHLFKNMWLDILLCRLSERSTTLIVWVGHLHTHSKPISTGEVVTEASALYVSELDWLDLNKNIISFIFLSLRVKSEIMSGGLELWNVYRLFWRDGYGWKRAVYCCVGKC